MYISTRLRICASRSSSIHPDIPQDYGPNIKIQQTNNWMNIEEETKCCFPMIHSNHNNSVYIIVLLFIHLFKYTKEEKERYCFVVIQQLFQYLMQFIELCYFIEY
ncbi:unnamed protein product [Schistosoma intercalatum]|nr:unnamed protein product [Schistosoma intercalatum]CAH8447331.1 unnamed protein product [Schistosoma intercalatum]